MELDYEQLDGHTLLKKLVQAQTELAYAIHGLVEVGQVEVAIKALRVLVVTHNYKTAVDFLADEEQLRRLKGDE